MAVLNASAAITIAMVKSRTPYSLRVTPRKGEKNKTYTAAVRCIRMFRSVFTVWKNPRAASRKLSACVRVLPFVFQSGTMLNGVAGSARQAELRHNVFFFFTHAHALHASVFVVIAEQVQHRMRRQIADLAL